MPSRHTEHRCGRAVSDHLLELALACVLPLTRGAAIVQELGECCRVTRNFGGGVDALTLLPQASDTNVAATLEMMRARCSC